MEERRLETNIGKLLLRTPLLTASGTSGSADELGGLRQSQATLQTLGGFVTKGVTLEPRKGNPEPRVIETRAGLLNSIGLQNKGADRFLREDLPKLVAAVCDRREPGEKQPGDAHRAPLQHLPIIVNISANTVEEYGQLAARLLENDGGQIASLEINVSCPNIKEGGVQFGIDPCSVEKIVSGVKAAVPRGRVIPIITKMTPNITDVTVPAKAAIAGGTDALSVINTLRGVAIDIKAQKPYFANVSAGLSGPAIKPIGLCMVWDCFEKIPECRSGKVPIVGMGGISTWEDVVEYILAGATAVGIGTAWFVYPQVFVEMHKGLVKYLAKNDTSVRKLTGKAHG